MTEFAANLVRLFAEATALNIEATASIAQQMKFIHRGMQSWARTPSPVSAVDSINVTAEARGTIISTGSENKVFSEQVTVQANAVDCASADDGACSVAGTTIHIGGEQLEIKS